MVTCRFADGREIALDEFPLASLMGSAETVRAEEIELSSPEGRSVRVLVNATPIRSGEDAVASVVVTMQDLEPLEELERMRAAFLGMVSHELRAPLTSIKGSTAMVLGETRAFARAEMLQFFRIVDEQAERMSALIGDLLDAGRIEAGALSVEPEALRVADLVEGARTTFLTGGGSTPRRPRPSLRTAPGDGRPGARRAGAEQPAGQRRAALARGFADPDRGHARGGARGGRGRRRGPRHRAGAPLAPVPQVFRRGRGQRGVGLGLAICKGLVEAHGGRIRAESGGPGLGARFTFTLPAVEEAGAEAATERSAPRGERTAAHPGGRRRPADAAPRARRPHGGGLRPAGDGRARGTRPSAREGEARPGPARLHAARNRRGRVDGARVPGSPDVPVIFISGYGRDETVARALEAGAEDYVVKPFSPTELVARVRAALRRRAEPAPFVLGELAIDYDARRVSVGGRAVELTATEYELLRALSLEAGRVCDYETLLRRVWGGRRRGQAGLAGLRQAAAQEARRRRPQTCVHHQRVTGRLPHATARRSCARSEPRRLTGSCGMSREA